MWTRLPACFPLQDMERLLWKDSSDSAKIETGLKTNSTRVTWVARRQSPLSRSERGDFHNQVNSPVSPPFGKCDDRLQFRTGIVHALWRPSGTQAFLVSVLVSVNDRLAHNFLKCSHLEVEPVVGFGQRDSVSAPKMHHV